MAPPDLPSKELYIPLGQLLQDVQSGSKFKPVTLDFIRRESQPATSPAPASKVRAEHIRLDLDYSLQHTCGN